MYENNIDAELLHDNPNLSIEDLSLIAAYENAHLDAAPDTASPVEFEPWQSLEASADPRPSNTGVIFPYPHSDRLNLPQPISTNPDIQTLNPSSFTDHYPTPDALCEAFEFDAYAFSVLSTRTYKGVTDCLAERSRSDRSTLEFVSRLGLQSIGTTKGGNGFAQGIVFSSAVTDTEEVARVMIGSKGGNMPNVEIRGAKGKCHDLSEKIRNDRTFQRILSRVDVKLDISMPGLFDMLAEASKRMVAENGKMGRGSFTPMGSDEDGRTVYVGARSSALRIRVYEKSKEMATKGLIEACDVDPHHVRVELQFRPQKDAKHALALLSAADIVRTRAQARAYIQLVHTVAAHTAQGAKMQKIKPVKISKKSDTAEKFAFGMSQYANTFARHATAKAIQTCLDNSPKGRAKPLTEADIRMTLMQEVEKHFVESGTIEKIMNEMAVDHMGDEEATAKHYAELAEDRRRQRIITRVDSLAGIVKIYASVAPHLVDQALDEITKITEGHEEWMDCTTIQGVPFYQFRDSIMKYRRAGQTRH